MAADDSLPCFFNVRYLWVLLIGNDGVVLFMYGDHIKTFLSLKKNSSFQGGKRIPATAGRNRGCYAIDRFEPLWIAYSFTLANPPAPFERGNCVLVVLYYNPNYTGCLYTK